MNNKNFLLILLTIILFGISAFFRKLSVDRIHPYQLQIVAGLVYMAEVPIWLWLINKTPNIQNYNFCGVIFGILCLVTYVIAAVLVGFLMKSTNSIGALSAMIATSPMITAILSYFLLNEEFTAKKIIAIIITISGIVLFNF